MQKPKKAVSKLQLKKANNDGWQNVVTGVGVKGKDKNMHADISWSRIPRATAEAIFSADDIGGKIASLIPFDGTRAGITWSIAGDESDDFTKTEQFLSSEFDRVGAWSKFNWAWTMARVFGGAIILMVVDDGSTNLAEPLNMSRIREIKGLHVIERWSLDIHSDDIITDISSAEFGQPSIYHYNVSSEPGNRAEYIKIHHSRVLRFDGIKLPTRLYQKNDYWHDSVYGRLFNAIRNYSSVQDSVPTIIAELNQPVFKIDGLNEAIQMDNEELVVAKLNFVNLMRSSLRAIVLDGDDEFDYKQVAISGIKDLLDIPRSRLIAASHIPHTRLMGESPGASLGEQGRSQLIDYYDYVAAQQKINLENPINRLIDIIFSQIKSNMTKPDNLKYKFNPLYQDSQETIIRTRHLQAQIDQLYMNSGVYDSFEVAENRFASGEYSYETSLELEDRKDDEFDQKEIDENMEAENEQDDNSTEQDNDKV